MPGGRPSKLTPAILAQARALALIGLTDAQMAIAWDVGESTINRWKKNDEFRESLKGGKTLADAEVGQALFQKAIGWDGQPPDTTACIFWLKNRQPRQFREKQEAIHSFDDDFMEIVKAAQHKPSK